MSSLVDQYLSLSNYVKELSFNIVDVAGTVYHFLEKELSWVNLAVHTAVSLNAYRNSSQHQIYSQDAVHIAVDSVVVDSAVDVTVDVADDSACEYMASLDSEALECGRTVGLFHTSQDLLLLQWRWPLALHYLL